MATTTNGGGLWLNELFMTYRRTAHRLAKLFLRASLARRLLGNAGFQSKTGVGTGHTTARAAMSSGVSFVVSTGVAGVLPVARVVNPSVSRQ
jgi:hypothetical protein